MKPITIAAIVFVVALAATASEKKAGELMQAAQAKKTIQGDLKAAIQLYGQAAKEAGSNRALAAKALLGMAESYQKMGDAQARKVYQRIVSEYADQKEAVAEARAALSPQEDRTEMTEVSVWNDAPIRGTFNVASTQPLMPYRNYRTGDLMLRNLATGETRNLTQKSSGAKGNLFGGALISTDGKMVAFEWSTLITADGAKVAPRASAEDRKEFRTIGADGAGMKVHLSEKNASFLEIVAISTDNKTLLVTKRVDASGQTPAHPVLQRLSLADGAVTPFASGFWGNAASFSPDGKLVALAGVEAGRPSPPQLFVANSDGTNLQPLLPEPVFTPRWTPDGKWIVFGSDRTGDESALWAIAPTGGEPHLVKQEPALRGIYGFTRDGSLFYSAGQSLTDIQIARLNPVTHTLVGGASRFVDTNSGKNNDLKFSPDGKWMAWRSSRPGGLALVVRATSGGDERVVNKLAGVGSFAWFPDSSALLVRQLAGQESVMNRVDVADGRVTELAWGTFLPGMPLIADGGRSLLWTSCDSSGCTLRRIDTQTKAETVEPMQGMGARGPSVLSPDGRWLAVVGWTPSATENSLFIRPTTAGGKLVERVQGVVATTGAPTFVFTPDSKQVVYQGQLNELWMAPVEGGQPVSIGIKGQYPDFHPDGRLTFTQDTGSPEVRMLRNIRLN